MKRFGNILVGAVVWGGILFYMIWASGLSRKAKESIRINDLHIEIADSSRIAIITPETVRRWIFEANLNPEGASLDSFPARAITECVAAHDFVANAKTFADLNGRVTVQLTQRMPILRIISEEGYNIYVSDDGHILPAGKHAAFYVPVVTGEIKLPFPKTFHGDMASFMEEEGKKTDKNYLFLHKLINFVKYIEDDEFWNAQVVQINVVERRKTIEGKTVARVGNRYVEPEVEIVPRIGNHIVLLGEIDGFEKKLDKLERFYRDVLSKEGWNSRTYINLKYENQVICK